MTASPIKSMSSTATMRARMTVPGASGIDGIRTRLSISGASYSERPTASSPSIESMITRSSLPTCAFAHARPWSWKSETSASRRSCFTSSSTWSSKAAAGVPSSCEYANAPPRSKPSCSTLRTNSWCSASVSPGKPQMNVVRSTSCGILALSFSIRAVVEAALGRRILTRVVGARCCSGMSMYFTTFSSFAIVSISSSEK
mmetsp:Transcript_34690/g.86260  ORF Transcript_34690/g.86260 Transcript_34690/m.86260 type:complete len:200 (-) Transcript_34690:581-1180(-)